MNNHAHPPAADAFVVMKDSKMMLVTVGNAIAAMDYEITLPDGSKVLLDGTIVKDGKAVRMTEGQRMTLEGTLIEVGSP